MQGLTQTVTQLTTLITACVGLAVACGSLWQALVSKRHIRENRHAGQALAIRLDAVERRNGEEDRRSGQDRRSGPPDEPHPVERRSGQDRRSSVNNRGGRRQSDDTPDAAGQP